MLVIRILINYYRHSYDRQHFFNDTCQNSRASSTGSNRCNGCGCAKGYWCYSNHMFNSVCRIPIQVFSDSQQTSTDLLKFNLQTKKKSAWQGAAREWWVFGTLCWAFLAFEHHTGRLGWVWLNVANGLHGFWWVLGASKRVDRNSSGRNDQLKLAVITFTTRPSVLLRSAWNHF